MRVVPLYFQGVVLYSFLKTSDHLIWNFQTKGTWIRQLRNDVHQGSMVELQVQWCFRIGWEYQQERSNSLSVCVAAPAKTKYDMSIADRNGHFRILMSLCFCFILPAEMFEKLTFRYIMDQRGTSFFLRDAFHGFQDASVGWNPGLSLVQHQLDF